MVSDSKIEFLIKQGYDKNVIDILIDCGVEKQLLWFLTINKKGFMKNLNIDDIKVVNKYLEECSDAVKYLSSIGDKTKIYTEAVRQACNYKKDLERKEKNIIYSFENGYSISILNEQDLQLEGKIMSNCVGGYYYAVKNKDLAILALKNPSKKTIVHIEVKKNGQLAQNFSKANAPIGNEYWRMILEFFEKNSKKVDFKSLFGDAYVTSSGGGYINSVSLCIPTSITHNLKDGVKKVDFNDAFELKRFSLDIPKNTEEIKFLEKSDLINWLQNKKNEILKVYDDLTEQINLTNSSDLYLSDEIKEKIFGNHKNAYLMKGEKYNISEINIESTSHVQEEPAMPEPAEVIDLDIPERLNGNYGFIPIRPIRAFAAPGINRRVNEEAELQERLHEDLEKAYEDDYEENNVEVIGNQAPNDEVYPDNGPVADLVRGVYENVRIEEAELGEIQEGDMVEVPNVDGTYDLVRIEQVHAPIFNQELEMPPAPFEEILRRAK